MSDKPPSYYEASNICKKTTVDVMIKIVTNQTGRTTDFTTIQMNSESTISAIPLIPVAKRFVEMNDAYTTSLLPNTSGISVNDAQGNKTPCSISSAACCARPFSGELFEFIQNMLIMILAISFLIFIFKLLADSSKISH